MLFKNEQIIQRLEEDIKRMSAALKDSRDTMEENVNLLKIKCDQLAVLEETSKGLEEKYKKTQLNLDMLLDTELIKRTDKTRKKLENHNSYSMFPKLSLKLVAITILTSILISFYFSHEDFPINF